MAAKNTDAAKRRHFKGVTFFWRWYDTLKTICLVKIITWIGKVNVINNSAEIICIFAVDNSINAYLTEK